MIHMRYRVTVVETVSPEGDIDPIHEQVWHEDYETLREALEAIAYMVLVVGVDAWDDLDGTLCSCWLPYSRFTYHVADGEGLMVSYTISLDGIEKRPMNLTLERIRVFV